MLPPCYLWRSIPAKRHVIQLLTLALHLLASITKSFTKSDNQLSFTKGLKDGAVILLTEKNNMEKIAHQYKLTLEYLQNRKGETVEHEPLELTFENHDDIFSIIERQKAKDLFGDAQQATEFAIGLKLFSEVMIKHRKDPLFEELAPAFGAFMKKLKAMPAKDATTTIGE